MLQNIKIRLEIDNNDAIMVQGNMPFHRFESYIRGNSISKKENIGFLGRTTNGNKIVVSAREAIISTVIIAL